jgi:membrane associated rhomboid family serine protease
MAFGFTPTYSEILHLDDLSNQQFLVIATEVVKKLEWKIQFLSDTGLIAFTNKGIFKWNAKITISIDNEVVTLKSESTGNEMFDWGKNRKTITQFTNLFYDSKYAFNSEEISQKYEELKPNVVSGEEDILSRPAQTSKQKIQNFFSIFIPKKGFFITPILVDLNVFIFVLMIISGANFFLPDNASLIHWGANFRPVTLDGQWWRLITNCFVHIGVIHLLLNMYALLYIGLLLEPYLDKAKFTIAYLLTGIIASLTSLYWHDLTISAGASGAIFGMYGVFLAMLTTNIIDASSRKALLASIGIFVAYNLINGIKGGIDNAAHLGGLISGLTIGYCFYPSLKNPESDKIKYSTSASLAVIVILTSFIVYNKIPKDILKYDNGIKRFTSMESMALEVYKMPQNSTNEQVLDEIKNRGLYYWNENLKLMDSLDKLDLSKTIHNRNMKLVEYCNLRINTYQLIYKAINENTNAYKDSIEYYNDQISSIINKLKKDH